MASTYIQLGPVTEAVIVNFPSNPVPVIVENIDPILIEGTVTANIGTTGGLALDTTLTDGSQKTEVTNGAGAAAVNIQDGGNSITVDAVNLDIRSLDFSTDSVNISGSTVAISGTVPISGTITADQGTTPWTVDGTVIANVGTTGGLALDSTLTDKSQFTKITDGTDTASVTAAGELNVLATAQPGVDIGDVTVNNGPAAAAVNIQDGGNSITVDATDLDIRDLAFATDKVDVTGSTVAISGTIPISGTVTANQGTTPWVVSGTVTSNIGTTNGLALDATLTNKSQFTKITDGTDTALVTAAGEVNVLATAQPGVDIGDVTINNGSGASAVNIQDGGNSLTVDGTVSLAAGSAVIGHIITDSGSTTVVTGNVTVVQPTGTNLHTVVDSGSITANAGTNLNTSALALESGGNLASIKTNTDNLNLAQASTTSGQKGNLVLGATTTAAPTYTTAQSNPLSLTTAGAVRVDASATTQPVSGTVTVTQATGTNLHAVIDSGTITTTLATVSTATLTNVSGSASSVQLLASTAGRKMATFYNDSTVTAYLKLGTTASTTSYTVLMRPNDYYELSQPVYTGRIDAIWDSAAGAMRITEMT